MRVYKSRLMMTKKDIHEKIKSVLMDDLILFTIFSGLILSSQQLGYTFVKFIGGTLADILDPGVTFTACLLLTGFTCAAFTGNDVMTIMLEIGR